jgi:tetratricopeptide (TPR) repeat protein
MAALTHLSKVFPSDDYTHRETWRDYLPHVALLEKDEQYKDTEEMSKLRLKVGRCLFVDGRMKEAVLWLRESCEWRDKNLAQDDEDRLLSQHVLAIAYEGNGQVKEAVKMLEHITNIKAKVLADDHPHRLASEHELARAYHANSQVKEAIKLLKRVVTIKAEVLAENHPSRLASEMLLADIYEDLSQISETEQAYASSVEDPVADGEERSHFEHKPKTSQVISDNSNVFTAMANHSPPDQEPRSSGKSKRRGLVAQLKGILKKVK